MDTIVGTVIFSLVFLVIVARTLNDQVDEFMQMCMGTFVVAGLGTAAIFVLWGVFSILFG